MNVSNMFDSHIHTKYSTDSQMDIRDVIRRADELNIGVIITDHMDINYPIEGEFCFNPEEYFKEYSKYRNDKLLLGIELGMDINGSTIGRTLIDKYPFDYVIGSIHLIDNIDLFEERFYNGKNKTEIYIYYLENMLRRLRSHEYIDSLGHIDFIARYARYDDRELYYDEFSDYIDEILKEVAKRNIAMEINTRRLSDNRSAKNLEKIYRRFYELGGRMVTLGSDAHVPGSVGNGINNAREIADRCGLSIVYYKERKPQYVK